MDDARSTPPGDEGGAAPGAAPPPPPPQGWLDALQSVLQELPGLVSDRVELFSLELVRAGRALAQILMLVVAAAVLAVTGWLALWAGITVALLEAGLHWAVALAVVLALNLVAALLALRRIRSLVPLLRLPRTRRHLTLSPGASVRHANEAAADERAAA
ncbi:MAG: phage holin family protein [Rubrivivax sp.]